MAAALLLLARLAGLSAAELGLSRSRVRPGLALGGAVAAVLAGGIVVGAALPWTRPLFEDQRIADVEGPGELAYRALVRVPLGTVALEELAFRGVVLALVAARRSTRTAVAVSSLLFGLWHVEPTLDALAANDLAEGPLAAAGAVSGAVVFTAVGGVLFCLLRLASGSLLAPVVVHAATNSVATTAAYVVLPA